MATIQRTMLIVEDDPILNELYKIHCRDVLAEFPQVNGLVQQAYSYEQAIGMFRQQPADFISVDIALSRDEQGKTDQQRDEGEAGGMALLRDIQDEEKQPFVVVVTGETLQSYAIDAYQAYGVLAFFQKDRFNNEEYKNAIRASLWYLNSVELIQRLEIDAAMASWNQALQAARAAGIKERSFENLGYRIRAIREGLTHPTTGLPSGRWTDDRLKTKIVGAEDNWALIRVAIRGFSNFITVFPSQEGPILSFVAELLKQTRQQFQDEEIFVGHLGHHEHMTEPMFVLIPGQKTLARVAEITTWLEDRFAASGSRPFASDPELENQKWPGDQPLPDFFLDIRILPDGDNTYFPDLPFLIDTLGGLP